MTPIPMPDNTGRLGSLAYHPHDTAMRQSQHHMSREGQPESQYFHLCQLIMSPQAPPPHNVSDDYLRILEFSPYPSYEVPLPPHQDR